MIAPTIGQILASAEFGAGGCLLWTGRMSAEGYGRIPVGRSGSWAHRVSFELFIGPIPAGLVIDHLCRVRHCINPAHMRTVTNRVNVLAGIGPSALNAVKTHCLNGHAFTVENTRWTKRGRNCKACQKDYQREWAEDRRRRGIRVRTNRWIPR